MIRGHDEMFREIRLRTLGRADAVRMLFQICKNQREFRYKFPSDKDLFAHPIFE